MEIIYLISGILICQLIAYSSKITFPINQKYLKSFPSNFLMQIYFGICSLILMYAFGYKLKFSIGTEHIWTIVYQVFILFFISFLIIGLLIDFIKNKSPVSESDDKKENFGTSQNQAIFEVVKGFRAKLKIVITKSISLFLLFCLCRLLLPTVPI